MTCMIGRGFIDENRMAATGGSYGRYMESWIAGPPTEGKGQDARLVCLPNENHRILPPQNSICWYREVHDWLERYLTD